MNSIASVSLKRLCLVLLFFTFIFWFQASQAQFNISTQKENGLLSHGIEQYHQGHYHLSQATLERFLTRYVSEEDHSIAAVTGADAAFQKARYYLYLSIIKNDKTLEIEKIEPEISKFINPDFKAHLSFQLGRYFFRKNQLDKAIRYYNQANIIYLNNGEVVDKKFELAYCYFNNHQFSKAMPLFTAIKNLPDNKYYYPGNYYYGLLAYNDKNYKQALESFRRIDKQPVYKDIVPYYEAEIYYFLNRPKRVLDISKKYLQKDSLYYTKDMRLLTAQTLFEQKKYSEALPYFEDYYQNNNRIRKEILYELAYSYYRLKDWSKAIERFQPLSEAKDSLGQTAMYLLGDCYLKTNDKKGARNAFSICSNMDFNALQARAASFLYAKLSYELGYETLATKKLSGFIEKYPDAPFLPEAKTLLSQLLAKGSNYTTAFRLLSKVPGKDESTWRLYQRVAVGSALQAMQNNHLRQADSIFNLSLQQPLNPAYEAVAYFWKSEIAYREAQYKNAVEFSKTFLNKEKDYQNDVQNISTTATPENAQMIIGFAQMKQGDYSHAGAAFAQAKKSGNNNNSNNGQLNALATLHEADASFMQKDFKNAAKYYQEALANGTSHSDYATYQLSLIKGLTGDMSGKKALLEQIIDETPASSYQAKASFELAQTQLNEGDVKGAIHGFEDLLQNGHANENIKSKSLLQLAYAYRINGETQEAIDHYKKYLHDYPADTSRDVALDALNSLFVAKGQPEEYMRFLKENNLPVPNDSMVEKTYYDAAIQEFTNKEWQRAVTGFSHYLNQFPKGANAVKAHFYRGLSYQNTKAFKNAVSDFDSVLNAGWSEFSADAAKNAAQITFDNKNYEAAYRYYSALRNVSTQSKDLTIAYKGLLTTAFNLTKYERAEAFADTLLTLPNLNKNVIAQTELYKAKCLQELNYPKQATALYQKLDKENIGAVSAEARYHIAEISFDNGDLKSAEKQAGYAVQASGGQDYWIVKCYLLLGDILTQEKDYFNAKATFSSIVKNTNIASLKEVAAKKLEAVKALEKVNSKTIKE